MEGNHLQHVHARISNRGMVRSDAVTHQSSQVFDSAASSVSLSKSLHHAMIEPGCGNSFVLLGVLFSCVIHIDLASSGAGFSTHWIESGSLIV